MDPPIYMIPVTLCHLQCPLTIEIYNYFVNPRSPYRYSWGSKPLGVFI